MIWISLLSIFSCILHGVTNFIEIEGRQQQAKENLQEAVPVSRQAHFMQYCF